jgi:hypothetical protein
VTAGCARRHDRRADLGQHRHRAGDRRAAEGLPRDRGDAGQDVEGEDRPAARLRGRGRRRADRRPPDSPQSYYRVADRLTAEIPGAFQPNQYATRPTRRRTTSRPGRAVGADRRADHPPRRRRRHRRHGHRHGPLPARAQARARRHRRRPEGSIYSGGAENVRPYLSRASARTSGRDVRPVGVDRWVTVSDRDAFLTTRRLAQPRGSWPAARAAWRCTPRSRSPPRSTIPRR